QEHAQAPLLQRVAQEKEVASPEPRGERHGERTGNVGRGEVVEVVVFADDEALPLASGAAVDAAVDLEDHAPPLERDIRVRIRRLDDDRGPVGARVQELPLVSSDREVRDDVELAARRPERLLEELVE